MPALAAPAAGGGSRATAGLVLLLCLACQCLAQAQQEGCLLTLLRKPDAAINCTDTRPGNICMLSATIFPSNTNMPTNRYLCNANNDWIWTEDCSQYMSPWLPDCRCNTSSFTCSQLQISTTSVFPWPLTPAVTNIVVARANLLTLRESAFTLATHLQRLALTQSSLVDMEDDVFNNNDEIVALNLSSNHLARLVLPMGSSLKTLDFSHNPLQSLDEAALLLSLHVTQTAVQLPVNIFSAGTNFDCSVNTTVARPSQRLQCRCKDNTTNCGLRRHNDSFADVSCRDLFLQRYPSSVQPPAELADIKLPSAYICDGHNDCPGNVDELDCMQSVVRVKFVQEVERYGDAPSACFTLAEYLGKTDLSVRYGQYFLRQQPGVRIGIRFFMPLGFRHSMPPLPQYPNVNSTKFEDLPSMGARGPLLYGELFTRVIRAKAWVDVRADVLLLMTNVSTSLSLGGTTVDAGPTMCYAKLLLNSEVSSLGSSSSTTPPSGAGTSQSPGKSGRTGLIAGCAVGLAVVLVAVIFAVHYRRQTSKGRYATNVAMVANDRLLEMFLDQALQAMASSSSSANLSTAEAWVEGQADRHSMSKDCAPSPKRTPVAVDTFLIDPKRLSVGQDIGQGHFGYVKQGLLDKTTPVAVKSFATVQSTDDIVNILVEALVLSQVSEHPCIINVLGMVRTMPPRLVLELAAEGSLRDFVRTDPQRATLDFQGTAMCQASSALAYLAAQRLVHRDLAARNVLVRADYSVCLADFGMARKLASQDYYRATGATDLPLRWMAPESILKARFSAASDVWSLAMVAWEIAHGCQTPYGVMTAIEITTFLQRGERLTFSAPDYPSGWRGLWEQCWATEPQLRPRAQEVNIRLESMRRNTVSGRIDMNTRPAMFTESSAENRGAHYEYDPPTQATLRMHDVELDDATCL